MSRNLSLLILFGTVVAIGVLFFKVVWPFLFPLFFAAVLTVLFRPFFGWVNRHCHGRRHIAAALVTVAVIAVVVLPLAGMLTIAGMQLMQSGQEYVKAIALPDNTQKVAEEGAAAHQSATTSLDWKNREMGTRSHDRRFSETTAPVSVQLATGDDQDDL